MRGTKEWLMVENSGELDLRLLELMGASTKDGESTIGMFGTGWKYGLALALRKKMKVIVFSGTEKIEFSKISEKIRGNSFHRISFSVDGKRRRKTSMTTKLGESDWTDEWMFLREVLANAFDEGGFQIKKLSCDEAEPHGNPSVTRVFMTITPRIREVLENMEYYVRRHGYFEENQYAKLFNPLGEKGRIYKRGIFVKELDSPSLYDYDLTDLKLTESRSADSWEIGRNVREALTHSSLGSRKRVLVAVEQAKRDDKKIFESSVEFYDWDAKAQEAWSEAFIAEYGEDAVLCEGSQIVVGSLGGLGRRAVTLPERVAQVLRKGRKVTTEKEVLGNGVSEGFIYRDPTEYETEVLSKGIGVMHFIFGEEAKKIPVRVFKKEGKHEHTTSRILEETDASMVLLLNESVFVKGSRFVVETMYREFLNIAGRCSSDGETFKASAQKALVEQVLPKIGVVI